MVVVTVCLGAFLTILLSFVSYRLCMGCVRSAKLGNKQTLAQNGTKSQRMYQHPESISHLSFVGTFFWSVFFGGSRVTDLLLYLAKWNRIVKFTLFNMRFLIINDLEMGKELLKNPVFCARPMFEVIQYYAQGENGNHYPALAFNSGKSWSEHRKFCHHNLKKFGLGTKRNEILIQHEIDELIKNWLSKKGQRFSPNKDFYDPIINTLWLVLAGRRTTAQTAKLFVNYNEIVTTLSNHFNAIVGFSGISKATIERVHNYIPIFPAFKAYTKSVADLRSYLKQIINSKKEFLSFNEEPKDLIDAYLNEIHKESDGGSFSTKIEENNLHTVLIDLMFAGGDTTTGMLAWAMLHLIRNPNVQEKLWNEIDTQVGKDRSPTLNDRNNCPYTVAFIQEILRFSPVALIPVPHTTSENTYIGTQLVEKDTVVELNIYAIHHDPLIWGDPENFRPERFLSEDGLRVEKNESFCGFGVGPRKCVGEQVARDNLFLLISSICQRFRLKQDPLVDGMPSLCDQNGFLHSPKTFYMVAEDRF